MKFVFFSLVISLLVCSCIPTNKWEKATITYNDNTQKEAYVYASKWTYYNFVRVKFSLDEHRIIYPPDSLKSISNENFTYRSLFYDEERFGMESYGFVKKLAGNKLFLGVGKFKMKTCACKTSGGYFKGYFLVHGDKFIKLKTDIRKNITNINELNSFIENENIDFEIPQQTKTIKELILLIEKMGE